jgi:RNA recognition motif-containing protein
MNSIVSEEFLELIFSPYGEIADITIKRNVKDYSTNVQSGYGFVYFLQPNAALAAIQTLKKYTIGRVTLACRLSYRTEEELIKQSILPQVSSTLSRTGSFQLPKQQSQIKSVQPLSIVPEMVDIHTANCSAPCSSIHSASSSPPLTSATQKQQAGLYSMPT